MNGRVGVEKATKTGDIHVKSNIRWWKRVRGSFWGLQASRGVPWNSLSGEGKKCRGESGGKGGKDCSRKIEKLGADSTGNEEPYSGFMPGAEGVTHNIGKTLTSGAAG